MAIAHAEKRWNDAELAAEGLQVWCGPARTCHATLKQLLSVLAVSRKAGEIYYAINGTGLAISRRPDLAEEIASQIKTGRPFTIVGDRISEI